MSPTPRNDTDRPAAPPQANTAGVQRLSEAAFQILETRPKDWEYRYFALILRMQLEELAGKYRDHELRTPRPSGDSVSMADALAYTTRATNELRELVESFVALRSPNTWETEAKAPDRPGDPERIRSLATSLTAVYEGLMDWAARIRGVNRPAELESLFLLLARFADGPVELYRGSMGIHDTTVNAAAGDSSAKDAGTGKVDRGVDEALRQSYLQEMRRLFPGS